MTGYFNWLKSQVDFLDFPQRYDRLFSTLFQREFIWVHPMDKNRAIEGQQLRSEYLQEGGKIASFLVPSNVLEVLVAISKRMNFICSSFDEDKTKIIFWRLIANLGLSDMDDTHFIQLEGERKVNDVLTIFMERKYDSSGYPGLFPMKNPRQNQREVEIWYQMNQYLSDPNGEDLKSY